MFANTDDAVSQMPRIITLLISLTALEHNIAISALQLRRISNCLSFRSQMLAEFIIAATVCNLVTIFQATLVTTNPSQNNPRKYKARLWNNRKDSSSA
jgi:hypothetical protein